MGKSKLSVTKSTVFLEAQNITKGAGMKAALESKYA